MNVKCSVCHSDNSVVPENAVMCINRCAYCGHVFKSLSKETREKYGEDYFSDEHKNWFNNPDYLLFKFIHDEVLKFGSGRRLKVLDVGCGNGNFLKYLRANNPALELYGIDLVSNRYPGIHFIKGDIMKDEIPLKFDVICNLAVIEHVDAPHVFMKKMNELLAPGGVIFTVTDNDDSMIYAAARLLNRLGINAAYNRLYSTHHLQCFSKKSLRKLAEMNGLEIVTHKNHNHPVTAVDYPKAGFLMGSLYALATHMIFMTSTLLGKGILQIAV